MKYENPETKIIRELKLTIKRLEKERDGFSFSRKEITRQWMEVLDDVQKEHEKEIKKLKKTISELLDIVASLKNRNAELDEKRKQALSDYYKTAQLVHDVTDGALSPSVGMINGLCREFSLKSRQEQDKLFQALLDAPVMHVDGTAARVNGNNNNVVVCSNGMATMYFARENKGHAGVKDTPVETFGGILVHDHEACFYTYGSDHQECMVHIERYDSIVKTAAKEYGDTPPSDYYREGYNLYLRMAKYKHNHLLFLSNPLVEPDNNLCERKARILKGKINQAISLRSFEQLGYFCGCLSVVDHFATDSENNLYQSIKEIFKKPKPALLES